MSRITRRHCIQGTLAAVAGTAARPAAAATPARVRVQGKGIKLAMALGLNDPQRLVLARQVGLNYVVAGVSGQLGKVPRDRYRETLAGIKQSYADAGLSIAAVESHPVAAEKIKLGLPGRDEEIENYIAVIRALGQIGVPVLCYNFMAGIGWYRTRVDLPERGGALSSEFDAAAARALGLTEWGEISEQKMWSNIEYFLKAVIPVAAESNVKMALHPDDPPLSPLRGIARIVTSAVNYRRILDIVPSPVNGITFCQANFKAMGEDIEALAREWCTSKKIFFVHFRDIDGTREHFRETFHDNGPTDMARMLQV